MTLLDRHVFAEWLRAFLLSILAILGMLLLEDILDNLKDLLEWGASTRDILRYYTAVLPAKIPAILPLSLMISVLFSLGQLHRHQEIIAMRTAGLSLWRITRTIWWAAGLLAAALFYLNASLVPHSVETARQILDGQRFASQLRQKGGKAAEVGLIANLTFYNHAECRLWFINRYSQYNGQVSGLTVSFLDLLGREERRLSANEATYNVSARSWVLRRGREILFDPRTGQVQSAQPFDSLTLANSWEDPALLRLYSKRPQDLSFAELERLLQPEAALGNPNVNACEVQYHGILANPFACLVVVGLAAPFAVAGVRTNPLVGVSKSIGLFAAYYLISRVCWLLGAKMLMEPWMAAWLPIGLMMLLAVRLNMSVR